VVVLVLGNIMCILVGAVLKLQLHQFNCGDVPGHSVGAFQRGTGGFTKSVWPLGTGGNTVGVVGGYCIVGNWEDGT